MENEVENTEIESEGELKSIKRKKLVVPWKNLALYFMPALTVFLVFFIMHSYLVKPPPSRDEISELIAGNQREDSSNEVSEGATNSDNTPDEKQLQCMKEVAEAVFEPLREWVGGPIKINSFFRGEPVNTAIGGSKTSQHMKGQAIDIDDTFGHKTNAEMYNWIK